MKPRHFLMLAVFLVAAWLMIYGEGSPDAGVAQPVARSSAGKSPAVQGKTAIGAGITATQTGTVDESPQREGRHVLALIPRHELIADRAGGSGDQRLFATTTWAPPPPAATAKQDEPPGPPTAPPLPFTYLGKQLAAGQLEVYLARGDRVFVARNQTVIEGTYRVDSVSPPTLSLTYLPLNQVQTLSIGVSD